MPNELIRCPVKPDMSKMVYGDDFTPDMLHYMRYRDDKAGFIMNTMTNDALRNGPVYATPEDAERGAEFEPLLREASKQVRCFGYTNVLHLDGATKDLTKAIDKSVGIQVFHPYVTDVGGVTDWQKDTVTGIPHTFLVKPTPEAMVDIPVSAKRFDVWKMPDTWWQGYSAFSNSFDDAVGLRLWRSAGMRRIRDYATVRHVIQFLKGDGTTPIPQEIKDAFKKAFKNVPHYLSPGEIKIDTVGGPTQPEELGIVTEKGEKGAAVGGSITVADMTGGEAGQKLSVDANQATYAYALKDIQRDLFPYWKKTLGRLGIKITGFKSPAEIPPEKKIEILGKLIIMYGMCAPSIKESVGTLIENYFAAEFNIIMTVDAVKDLAYTESQQEKQLNDKKPESNPDKKEKGEKKKWFKKRKQKE